MFSVKFHKINGVMTKCFNFHIRYTIKTRKFLTIVFLFPYNNNAFRVYCVWKYI